MLGKNDVMVVIPVYRNPVDYEMISLQQCLRMLGNYPMTLVAPASMDVSIYLSLHPFFVERFDDSFFAGTFQYSQLLLSQAFYRRFSSYSYILIHQLDVFVFSDRLIDFCRQGYDYIGAPVPRWGWPELRNRVGNGGISLRRVSSCLKVLSEMPPEKFFASYHRQAMSEDFYFAGCSEREKLDFRVPSLRQALDFAVDYECFHCYRKLSAWLPFACHAWQKKPEVWKDIITSFGYRVPSSLAEEEDFTFRDSLRNYLFHRILRNPTGIVLRKIMQEMFHHLLPIALWGYGKDGQRWMEILQKIGLAVSVIFDRRAENRAVNLFRPSKDIVKSCRCFILITSRLYEREIADELQEYGLREGFDFMGTGNLLDEIGKRYYEAVIGFHMQHKERR